MRALKVPWIVWAGVAWSGAAPAAPQVDARAKYELAVQLEERGEAEKALVVIEDGLVIAPNDLSLLMLRGIALLHLRDYTGALAAYQAYLDAGAAGANRRQAQQIIQDLEAVQSTFLDVTLVNGPADIYLDSRTLGALCTAAPSCARPVMPGEYKVIAERPGFERWTGHITIERDRTTQLPVTLVERPSLLTVRVAQPGARVTVDGTAYDAPATVAAGTHRVVVSLAGHRAARLAIVAHEGKPVDLDVALTPLSAVPPPVTPHASDEPVARPWMLAGVGTFALGVGFLFGEKARSTQAEVRELCGAVQKCTSQSAFDRGHQLVGDAQSRATTSTLLLALGGAAVAAGGILWLIAPKEHPPRAAQVVPVLSGNHDAGLAVAGRF